MTWQEAGSITTNTGTSSTWTFGIPTTRGELYRVLYGEPGQPTRAAVMLTSYEPDLPRKPQKTDGPRTGRQYRAARRAYGRAVRAWKRAGKPRRVAWRGYVPNVGVEVTQTSPRAWTVDMQVM